MTYSPPGRRHQALAIQLDRVEIELSEAVGKARDAYAQSKGFKTRYGIVGHGKTTADNHILGVQAELAVARALRMPWKPNVGRIDGVDVGREIEVRSRRLQLPEHAMQPDLMRAGSLVLQRRDMKKANALYVLAHRYAVDPPGRIVLMGWAPAKSVLQRRWWVANAGAGGSKDGACILPHAELRPIPALVQHLQERDDERRRHDIERHHKRYCGSGR